MFRQLACTYLSYRKLFFQLFLVQIVHSFYPYFIWRWLSYVWRESWIYQFIFNLHSMFRIIKWYIKSSVRFDFPLIFEVKVNSFGFCLLFAASSILLSHFFLYPSLESNMEFPTSFFQLQRSQVLLIRALLIIKSIEQAF